MIIKDYQLTNSINSESFQSFLVYGPNEGLIRENIDIIYEVKNGKVTKKDYKYLKENLNN